MEEGEIVLTLTKIAGVRVLILFCDKEEHVASLNKVWRICEDNGVALKVTNWLPLVTENNPDSVYRTSIDNVVSLVTALLFDE